MSSISKIEQFRQVKTDIRKNGKYLLVGIDAGKHSSVACFSTVANDVLVKKHSVTHTKEEFQRFMNTLSQTMSMNQCTNIIVGVEPTRC